MAAQRSKRVEKGSSGADHESRGCHLPTHSLVTTAHHSHLLHPSPIPMSLPVCSSEWSQSRDNASPRAARVCLSSLDVFHVLGVQCKYLALENSG